MKTIAELAREAGVSKSLVLKLYRQGRLVRADGSPAQPERAAQTLLFPDDTTWDRTRAAYGSLVKKKGAKK